MLGMIAAALSAVMAPPPAAIPPGTVLVDPAIASLPPEVGRVFAEAVGSALDDAHFVPIPPPGRGRYLAKLVVTRTPTGVVTTPVGRSDMTVGAGNWGGSVAVGLPSRKSQLRTLIVTELDITILRQSDGVQVWHGRALTARPEGTREDAPRALARALAQAALTRFPEQGSEPASVP